MYCLSQVDFMIRIKILVYSDIPLWIFLDEEKTAEMEEQNKQEQSWILCFYSIHSFSLDYWQHFSSPN